MAVKVSETESAMVVDGDGEVESDAELPLSEISIVSEPAGVSLSERVGEPEMSIVSEALKVLLSFESDTATV